MSNSEKTYVKSGYWIKWTDKRKTFYKCCCKQEDLPSDPKIKWHGFSIGGVTYWTGNYFDSDTYYSTVNVKPKEK